MPKKKPLSSYEPLVTSRPQRNMRAKKVFDPSDNYIPRKRNKTSVKPDKNAYNTNKDQDTRPKTQKVNESLEISTKENLTVSPVRVQSHLPVITPSEKSREVPNICFICSKNTQKKDLIDCPICLIKAHKDCLVVNEPMWKFKLDNCSWLCKQCRKKHCSKCLKDGSQSEILRRCITCTVGLHVECYESYDKKPLHSLKADMFVCIPCMTLATQRVPEIEDDEEVGESPYSSSLLASSDDDFKSVKSHDLSIMPSPKKNLQIKKGDETNVCNIPNVTEWSHIQIYNYLAERLPKEIAMKIIDNEIDGRALLLIQRADITSSLGLKLGHAMKLYKEIRILQTQNTCSSVFWE